LFAAKILLGVKIESVFYLLLTIPSKQPLNTTLNEGGFYIASDTC